MMTRLSPGRLGEARGRPVLHVIPVMKSGLRDPTSAGLLRVRLLSELEALGRLLLITALL